MHGSIFGWLTIILKRDLLIAFRKSSTYITPLVFFLIVVTFFPLALGPQESLLSSLAPGVIWVAALLASLLAVETIFSDDFRDGTLDEFFISLEPSFILVFAKVLIHWLITGLPILFASLIAAIVLYLPFESFIPMLLSLILGTSFMSLLGALGAALSLGRSAILSAIIVLPFSIPTLLMGTSVISSSITNQDFSGFLMIMGAMLAIGIPLLCLLTVEALLLNYE